MLMKFIVAVAVLTAFVQTAAAQSDSAQYARWQAMLMRAEHKEVISETTAALGQNAPMFTRKWGAGI